MAETVSAVRFVRCPKCLKVLTEFPDLPVYQCGGCGTILRAKNRVATKGNVALGSIENNSQSISDSGSFSSGPSPLPKQAYSSKADDRVEHAAPPNLDVSELNAKGEPSEDEENGVEVRHSDLDSKRPTDQFALRKGDLIVESQPDESIRVKPENFLNEEMEKPLNPSPQGRDSPRSSNKVEESSESIDRSVASEEDVIDKGFGDGDGNSLRSTTRSSHAYDGSVSSTDEDRRDRVPKKYLLLSKRTFRHKKVLDSVDSVGKEAAEDDLGNMKMTTDVESQQHPGNLPERSSNERFESAILGIIDSKRSEISSSSDVRAVGRDISFESEDFHSVQNWIPSGSDGETSVSPSKDPLFHGDSLNHRNGQRSTNFRYLKHDQMKILRKVDELKDELTGLFSNTVEGKGVPHSKVRFSRIPISALPHCSCLHCHQEECRPHNICCHVSKAVNMVSDLPSCHHKAQSQNNEPKKLQFKEKMKTIKNYCRPILGGAPFVICYKCWELLHLPADFLIFRKRLHKLRCGACSEVLVFSFRPRAHRIPETPIEAQHPPSEVENSRDAVTGHRISGTHCNDFAEGDPISFSEDYGLSFVKSYSSEAEPALHVSRNSSDAIEKRDGNQEKGLRLHRLMGYSSASELLFHTGGFDEGSQSTEPSTPHFYRHFEEDGMGYGLDGTGTNTPISLEIHEEDESPERLRTRRRGPALQGLLKKGIRELNHGLQSVKLKAHSNG